MYLEEHLPENRWFQVLMWTLDSLYGLHLSEPQFPHLFSWNIQVPMVLLGNETTALSLGMSYTEDLKYCLEDRVLQTRSLVQHH